MSNIKCQIFGLLIAVLFLFKACEACEPIYAGTTAMTDTINVSDTMIVYYEKILVDLQKQLKETEIIFIKTQGQIDLILYLIEERKKTLK